MKVCFIAEANSCHTQRLANRIAQAGCEVHLISAYKVDIPGVKLHHTPIYSPYPWKQIINNLRVKRLIERLNPNIIHLFGLFPVSSLGAMFLVRNLKNLVISIRGSDVVPAGTKESFKEKLIKLYLLNKGDRLVSISEYLAHEVERYLKSSKKIDIIPGRVDVDMFHPFDRKRNNGVIRVGFAKILRLLSGPDILLKAFQYAHGKCKHKLLLRIAGTGPMESQLKEEAIRIGLGDSIEWLGWLKTSEQLRDFYHSIDIFIMPSRRESLGVAAMEASASGLPVIASRIGGIPEVVIHDETGFLVEPDDIEGFGKAIIRLAGDRNLRAEMGNKGRERAEAKFDWGRCISSTIDIYRQLIYK